MSRPNFEDIARAWLVRAQGHSRPEYEKSLALELEKVFEAGRDHERTPGERAEAAALRR